MEDKSIRFYGIETNNLKKIDVFIPINKITAVTGISGGGKSSLAYDTIYKKCRNEYSFIDSGGFEEVSYSLKSCENIVPAIALKQKNSNVNPRSTLYSFLSLSELISSCGQIELPGNLLKMNKPGNECPFCSGNRVKASIDLKKIVEPEKRLIENPFKCWSGLGKGKYLALFTKMCESLSLDMSSRFCDLPPKIREKLLYGRSPEKFRVTYVADGKRRSRSEIYLGPATMIGDYLKSDKVSEYTLAEKFCVLANCTNCEGSGLNRAKYDSYEIFGVGFFAFLTLPVDVVVQKLMINSQNEATARLFSALSSISNLGIGYLSLSRSIPSLSGGEFQKLKFSRIINSQISGVLFVIDEISAQINSVDNAQIFSLMRDICARGNTIIMIEHNHYFIDRADVVYNIGPVAGAGGGFMLGDIKSNEQPLLADSNTEDFEFFLIEGITKNNLENVSVSVPINKVTGIYGVCGSGKSSFAKGVTEILEKTIYISQDLLKGNSRSTVATFLDLSDSIADMYAKTSDSSRELFLAQSGKLNVCPVCDGASVIDYVRGFDKTVKVTCPSCDGSRFAELADDILINEINIKSFFELSVVDLLSMPFEFPAKLMKRLQLIISLGLGHLSLGRKVSTLSGGEAKRLKIAKHLSAPKSNSVLIVDEPGSGLDNKTALEVMSFIKSLSKKFKAILIIEHKDLLLRSCDFCLCFGPGAGPDGGKIIHAGNYKPQR